MEKEGGSHLVSDTQERYFQDGEERLQLEGSKHHYPVSPLVKGWAFSGGKNS